MAEVPAELTPALVAVVSRMRQRHGGDEIRRSDDRNQTAGEKAHGRKEASGGAGGHKKVGPGASPAGIRRKPGRTQPRNVPAAFSARKLA